MIGNERLSLEEWGELLADAIIKRLEPVNDDLSRNEAERIFGARWLADMIGRGKAEGVRIGSGKTSKIIFSRYKLECLRMEQRMQARAILENK